MSFAKLAADALVSDLTPEVSLASEQETARKAKLRKALLYTAAGLAGVGAAGAGLYYANKSGVLDPVKNSISSALGDTGVFGGSRVAGGAAGGAAIANLAGSKLLRARVNSALGNNTLAALKTNIESARTPTHSQVPPDWFRRVFRLYDFDQRMAAERLAKVTNNQQVNVNAPTKNKGKGKGNAPQLNPGAMSEFESDLDRHKPGGAIATNKNLISQILAGEASGSKGTTYKVVDSNPSRFDRIGRFISGTSETQQLARNMEEIAARAKAGTELAALKTKLNNIKNNPAAVNAIQKEIADLSKSKYLSDATQQALTERAMALNNAAVKRYKRDLTEIAKDVRHTMGHVTDAGSVFPRIGYTAGRGLWGGIVGGGLGAASHMFW